MSKDWNQPDDAVPRRRRGDWHAGGGGDERSLRTSRSPRRRPSPSTRTRQADRSTSCSGLVYALLSLSVIVALLGINTLALAVFEHARAGAAAGGRHDRAAGTPPGPAESVITALIGAVLGLVLGIVFAVVVSRPLADEGFVLTFPVGTLITLAVLAAIAGVLAADPPARRAARVDVLQAVTTE